MPAGRPKFNIDYDAVKKLSSIQCTQEEIASYLGCSVDTLQRDNEFCGIYKDGMNEGRASLRRKQWKAVEDGNTTMLVWLGKQYLKQKDKIENEHKGNIGLTDMTEGELDRKIQHLESLSGQED